MNAQLSILCAPLSVTRGVFHKAMRCVVRPVNPSKNPRSDLTNELLHCFGLRCVALCFPASRRASRTGRTNSTYEHLCERPPWYLSDQLLTLCQSSLMNRVHWT